MLDVLGRLFVRFVSSLSLWLASLAGGAKPPLPTITAFAPADGWSGDLTTIRETSFSDVPDGVQLSIVGARALIITASTTGLFVLAGESTLTGLVVVNVTSMAP